MIQQQLSENTAATTTVETMRVVGSVTTDEELDELSAAAATSSSNTTTERKEELIIIDNNDKQSDQQVVDEQLLSLIEYIGEVKEEINHHDTHNNYLLDGEGIGEKKEVIEAKALKDNDQTPEASSEGIKTHGSFLSFEQLEEESTNALLSNNDDDNQRSSDQKNSSNNQEEKKSPKTPNSSSLVNMVDFSTILSNSEKLLSTKKKDDEEEEEEEEEETVSTTPIPLQSKFIHTKSEGNLDTFISRRNRTETYPSTPTLLKQRIMQKYKQQIQQQSSFATDTDTDDDMLLTSMSQNRYFRLFSLMIAKFFRIQSRVIAPNGTSPQSIEAIRKQEKANRTIQRDMLTMFISGFSMFGIFAIIWYNIYFNTDVLKNILEGRDSLVERLYFSMKCIFVSSWIFPLVFVAIVRNRLFEEASNPLVTNLINKEHQLRITIHQRVLQNSIEQFVMHSVSCLILGYYVSRENLRILVFATITFLLCRFFFWIGYSIHHSLRALGMFTNAITTIVMLCLSTYYITTQDILPFLINDILLPMFVIFSA